MDFVRIGFIGLGNITQTRHLPAIQHIGGAEIIGGADINSTLLSQLAERNKFRVATSDYHEVIHHPEIDAVFVNLPTHLHAEVTIAALDAGKHVFCEKPFAMNTAEAESMCEAAVRNNRCLMISNVERFAMRSQLMKRHLDSGQLGRPYYIRGKMLMRNGEPPPGSWFARREWSGGGALMDLGPPMIDLMLWLLDFPEVSEIGGDVGRFVLGREYDVDDFATVRFHAGDVSCYLELSWAHSHGPHANWLSTDIYASHGGVRCRASWSNDGPPLTIFKRGENDQISEDIIDFNPADPYRDQDKYFLECVRKGEKPLGIPENSLRIMRMIEEIYHQNGVVETPSYAPPEGSTEGESSQSG